MGLMRRILLEMNCVSIALGADITHCQTIKHTTTELQSNLNKK